MAGSWCWLKPERMMGSASGLRRDCLTARPASGGSSALKISATRGCRDRHAAKRMPMELERSTRMIRASACAGQSAGIGAGWPDQPTMSRWEKREQTMRESGKDAGIMTTSTAATATALRRAAGQLDIDDTSNVPCTGYQQPSF